VQQPYDRRQRHLELPQGTPSRRRHRLLTVLRDHGGTHPVAGATNLRANSTGNDRAPKRSTLDEERREEYDEYILSFMSTCSVGGLYGVGTTEG
jgi:hypothetical protein